MSNPLSESKQTDTPHAKPLSKWKDPEFIRVYYREKRRQQRGIKRHPNIMEDGSKWSDHHPWGKYETKEEFKESRKKYRKPVPKSTKIKCDLCQIEVFEAKWALHQDSIGHKKNVELVERCLGKKKDD